MRKAYIHILCLFCLLAGAGRTSAQLAITEAMPSASTNKGPAQVNQNSDWWELTNFGATPVDLTGYKFFDSGNNLVAADPTIFEGLTIGAGESVLFVQASVNTNELSVREWWGAALDAKVKIRFYTTPGLSSTGDGLRLWGPGATDPADVVDSVDFAEALRGSSFTYDPVTGAFGIYSTNGVGGAVLAATTDDVGSPGRTAGPAPLKVAQQPVSVVVNPGDTARFAVRGQGLPRGRVQWYFGESPIEGATKATLEIVDVQAANAGKYKARLNNGLATVDSAVAELVLQSQASAPAFTATPSDLTLTVGQSRSFHAQATAVPIAAYQWQFEGANIEGATSPDFSFAAASVDQTGDYSVIAKNALGAATNHFRITVTLPPNLVVTEVMSSANIVTPAHGDWWELSNLGTEAISLRGYRFDDNSESLTAAFTFTNDVTIAAGESVIFTEVLTPDAFRTWWGADKLPAGLKIITYTGNGLSSNGDAVNVWNAAATENFDKVASAVFSVATNGVSFRYNPTTQAFGELSVVDTFGAFTAAVGGDLGSPGYVTEPPPSLRLSASRTGDMLTVSWVAVTGASYKLQARDDLAAGGWSDLKTVVAAEATASERITIESAAPKRFYRVVAP